MDRKSGKFVDVDGIRTRYFDQGAGPTVLLVHGGSFGSNNCCGCALDWGLNIDGLSKHFRVISVDRLGQGFTDAPSRDEDFTMDAVVRHLRRFMERIDLEDVNIVGHSRGGYVTTRLTLESPERIRTITVVNSNTSSPGQGRNHIYFANTPRPYLTRDSMRWFLEKYAFDLRMVTEDWLDEMEEIAAQPAYRDAVERMEAGGLNRRQFLPGIGRGRKEMFDWLVDRGMQRPTLMVWSLNDPTATLDQGLAYYEIMARREPRTELHIFNEAGHFPYREHPSAFNEVIRGFVSAY